MRAALQCSSRALLGSALSGAARQARAVHVAPRRLIVAEGERQQQGEASASAPPPPQAAPTPSVRVPPQPRVRVPPPSPYGDNVQVWPRACLPSQCWLSPSPSGLAPIACRPWPPAQAHPCCRPQIERVETLGESRFSGVVALDSGDTPDNWG